MYRAFFWKKLDSYIYNAYIVYMTLEQQREKIRTELTKIYPQLVINSRKTCGAGYDNHGDDLLAMCIELYLEKPIEYQLKVIDDGKLENFITHLMGFQLKLGTTKYYHHYRKFAERQREFYPAFGYNGHNIEFPVPFEDEKSEDVQCIEQAIEKLNPYQKMLVDELIIKGNKYLHVSKKYNINYTSLKKDKEELIKQLKQTCIHWRSLL